MSTAIITAAALSVAAAAWLWPASIHIVSWDDDGPKRIAVVAPLLRLWWSLGLAAIAAALLYFAGGTSPQTRTARARLVTPLLLLALCVLPYLPWLPDRLPVLLVLAGPIRWAVLVAALAWCAARLSRWRGRAVPARPALSPRAVFVVSLVVYMIFGWRSITTIGLKGDEPHYLIISQSLFADGDLKIENNHRLRQYRTFSREELPPDFLQRGQDREIYSIHAPGLPAILLPAYGVAGQYGALLLMCMMAALAAVAIFELAALVAGPTAAAITWLAIAFSVPFIPYAWSIFPEMAGAAIGAWAAVWLSRPNGASSAAWMARGVAVALLPWLHTKFVILLAPLAVLLLLMRLRREATAATAFLAPIVVSLVAWFTSFYVIYGTPNPEAPYGNYARDWVRLAFVPRGLLGMLLDQKFGLLIYAPIYILVPFGLWKAAREPGARWLIFGLAAVAAAYAASCARLYMWWGGWSAPARFLVPAIPLVAPAMALAAAAATRSRAYPFAVGALILSVALAVMSAAVPERLLLFSEAHGAARWAEVIQGSAPLTATLPTFTESEWHPRDLIPGSYPPRARKAVALKGRMALMDALDPAAKRAFDYAGFRRLDANGWRRAATITHALAGDNGPPPLPATSIYDEGASFWTMGTERARAFVAPRGKSHLNVHVHIGPTGGVCRTWVSGDLQAIPLEPNGTHQLTVAVPDGAAWVAVAVQASASFRPADVDPNSTDQRLLGCQVRIEPW